MGREDSPRSLVTAQGPAAQREGSAWKASEAGMARPARPGPAARASVLARGTQHGIPLRDGTVMGWETADFGEPQNWGIREGVGRLISKDPSGVCQ